MGGWYQRILWTAAVLPAAAALPAQADPIPPVAEASNMQVIGHSDLNGAGKGGEGLALRQYPDGRRMLFLAHESAPMCFSVIEVTRPEDPKVVAQVPVEEAFVRCNSLGLSGTMPAWTPTTSATRRIRRGWRIWTRRAHIPAACTICGSPTASTRISRPVP